MDLRSNQNWTIDFKTFEFNLICKALRGISLNNEEKAQATELSNKMAVNKAKIVKQMAEQNNRLIENLKESGVWPTEA